MSILELRVAQLKTRVEHLEAAVTELTGGKAQLASAAPDPSLDQAQLLAWLRAEGIVRDPTPDERHLASEWDALPEEDRSALQWELDHLPPGPAASGILIENRR